MSERLEIPQTEVDREGHVLLPCELCKSARALVFRDLHYRRKAFCEGFPILLCAQCGNWAIPGNVRYLVKEVIQNAQLKGTFTAKFRHDGVSIDYSAYPPFKFSPIDYMFFPGLWRPNEDGALTPLFFRRRVLHRYQSDPQYDLHYTSNTYGTVVIPPGNHIPFGINRNDLVIMWLGDVAHLPEDEISYLRSENVHSDHDLASDFYRGQIDVEWDYESKERELLELHNELSERFWAEFGCRLCEYDLETTEHLKAFAEPALWTLKEVGHVWRSMNNVLVESLNVEGLKQVVRMYTADEIKGLKGLKLLEKLMGIAFAGLGAETLNPFFVLYDLRLVTSHKGSEQSRKMMKYCYERLGLDSGAGFPDLHRTLLEELCDGYRQIINAPISPRP